MKLLLLILSVVAVSQAATGAASTYEGLATDMKKFWDLLNQDKMVEILMECLANDDEVAEALEYCQSEEFHTTVLEIEAISAYRVFLKYLQENGLNVYRLLNILHEILGLPPFVPAKLKENGCGGVRGMVDQIEMTLPYDEIKAKHYELLQTSDAYKSFIDTLKSDDFKGLVKQISENKGVQEIVERLKNHGIDVQLIIDFLNKIFGWDIES